MKKDCMAEYRASLTKEALDKFNEAIESINSDSNVRPEIKNIAIQSLQNDIQEIIQISELCNHGKRLKKQ
jgi:hypothetical protein